MENMEERTNIITLYDENGDENNFVFLDLIKYEDGEYVVLLPVADEDDGKVVILRVEATENDDEDSYVSVLDDENIMMAVYEIFKENFKDVFHFAD